VAGQQAAERPRLGMYWAAGCGGCEIAVLEIHEHLLDLMDAVQIAFWPCVADFKYEHVRSMPDGAMDVCLFNGAIRNEENREMACLLRAKSKVLVAFGACACHGGIPGLANLHRREAVLKRCFSTESTDNPGGALPQKRTDLDGMVLTLPELLPRVHALGQEVEVDWFVPGCPPTETHVRAVLDALQSGPLPGAGTRVFAGNRSVCDECPLPKRNGRTAGFVRPHQVVARGDRCLLEEGIVCLGPATRSGCEARCPRVNMPCRGCYGPAGDSPDQGAKMIGLLGSLLQSEKEEEIRAQMDGIVDPAGTFYRFTLPTSTLKSARLGQGRTP